MGRHLPVSARTAVAVSVAALVTAAALFGVLVPEAAALPLPLPGAAAPANGELISVEGPLLNNLALPTLR